MNPAGCWQCHDHSSGFIEGRSVNITAREMGELLQIAKRMSGQQIWTLKQSPDEPADEDESRSIPKLWSHLTRSLESHFPELSALMPSVDWEHPDTDGHTSGAKMWAMATLTEELQQRNIDGHRKNSFLVKYTTPCPKCSGPRLMEDAERCCGECRSLHGKIASIWVALKLEEMYGTVWNHKSEWLKWLKLRELAARFLSHKCDGRELLGVIRSLMMPPQSDLNAFLNTPIDAVIEFLEDMAKATPSQVDIRSAPLIANMAKDCESTSPELTSPQRSRGRPHKIDPKQSEIVSAWKSGAYKTIIELVEGIDLKKLNYTTPTKRAKLAIERDRKQCQRAELVGRTKPSVKR